MPTSIASSYTASIRQVAGTVWRAVSQYGDLSWAMDGGIEDVELVGHGIGMVRKVRMAGMENCILERLVAFDDDAMSITYIIDGDGWPGLTDYVATAKVIPEPGGCSLRWLMNAKVDPAEVAELQAGLDAMAEGLVTLFTAQFETD